MTSRNPDFFSARYAVRVNRNSQPVSCYKTVFPICIKGGSRLANHRKSGGSVNLMHNTTTATTLLTPSSPHSARHWHRLPDAGSPGAPHSVWIAPPLAIKSPVAENTEMPVWAFEAACREYAPHGGAIAVLTGPTAPFDAEPVPTGLAPAWLQTAEEVELPAPGVEPVALAVVLDDPPPYPDLIGRDREGWHRDCVGEFYRDLAAGLAPGGIALVHTHTEPTATGLFDPAASTIRAAQAAGFGYLQHVVIVHTRLDVTTTPRYRAPEQSPVPPVCRRVHSDLYAFANPTGADR
jgi:hypothetical protein